MIIEDFWEVPLAKLKGITILHKVEPSAKLGLIVDEELLFL